MSLKPKKYKLIFKYFKEDTLVNLIKKKKKISDKYRTYNFCNNYNKNRLLNNLESKNALFFDIKYLKFFFYEYFCKTIKKIFVPILNLNWCYCEEILTFEGIGKYGFANWENISQHVKTKNIFQCEKHFLEIFFPYSNGKFFEINRLFSGYKKNKPNYKNFRNLLKISNSNKIYKFENYNYLEKFITDLSFTKNLTSNFIVKIKKISLKKKNKSQTILCFLFSHIYYINLKNLYFYNYTNKPTKSQPSLNNNQTYKKLKIFLKNKKKFEILYINQKKNNLTYKSFFKCLKILTKNFYKFEKYHSVIYKTIQKYKNIKLNNYNFFECNRNILNNITCKKDKLIYSNFGINYIFYIKILSFFILSKIKYKKNKFNKNIHLNLQNLLFLFDLFLINNQCDI
jgi:hypothetical protein